jgi:uncharacterized protein with NAD-binding domain and iron-sulfur cluster
MANAIIRVWCIRICSPYRAWNKVSDESVIEAHIYGPPKELEQPDALLLTNSIMDIYQAYPELRGHLISQHLQRNPATHTLPSLGPRGTHLGMETPWEELYCAGDWVRDPLPAFFLERAYESGIKAASAVLNSRKLQGWPLLEYLLPNHSGAD